jgi:hypothetical protein
MVWFDEAVDLPRELNPIEAGVDSPKLTEVGRKRVPIPVITQLLLPALIFKETEAFVLRDCILAS